MQYLSGPCIAVSHDSHTVPKPDHSGRISIHNGQACKSACKNVLDRILFVAGNESDDNHRREVREDDVGIDRAQLVRRRLSDASASTRNFEMCPDSVSLHASLSGVVRTDQFEPAIQDKVSAGRPVLWNHHRRRS